tara:strand:- start:5427 stop:7415 length:1989 start_codon:yes stop_codon:yes gene_type:complete
MTYKITYNGFGTSGATDYKWDFIKLQSYQSTPLFEEDDQTQWSTHHTLSFTALLTVTATAKIDNVINNCRTKLSKQGRLLVVTVNDGTGDQTIASTGIDTSTNLNDLTSVTDVNNNSDTRMYPRVKFDINQFYGNNNAMVAVTLEWRESTADTMDSGETNWFVLSHQWRQRFTFAENGLQTYTVEGTLRVKPYPSASESCSSEAGGVEHGTNPDSYRKTVMPMIPSGFRVKGMNWAVDQTGEKLIYSVVLQEHARGLPRPARTGTGTFTFKKSLTSGGAGLLGVKVFSAELEGDASCDERELLAALLDACTQRIKWTGRNKDWVTSIEVKEMDIFSKKRIGLTVQAQGLGEDTMAFFGEGQSGDLPTSNFGIFTNLIKEGRQAIAPNVYGSALIGAYKKQLFVTHAGYSRGNFPKAQPFNIANSSTTGTDPYSGNEMDANSCIVDVDDVVYELPGDIIVDPPPPSSSQGDLTGDFGGDAEGEISQDAKVLKVVGSERLGIKHDFAIVPMATGSFIQQFAWALGPPTIILESEYTITRHDKTPPMLMFKVSDDALVLEEQTSVDTGSIDGSGRKLYTRHHKRKVQLLYYMTDDATATFHDFTATVGGHTIHKRIYMAQVGKMFRAADARTDDVGEVEGNTVFGGLPGASVDEFFDVEFSMPMS